MADRHHLLQPVMNGCKHDVLYLSNKSALLRVLIVAASFLFGTIGHLSGSVSAAGAAAAHRPSRPAPDAPTSPSRESISTRISSPDHPPSLRADYYKHSCPHVEKYVRHAVKKATKHDPKAPAGLLRMHFHDCFIESGGPHWSVLKGRKDGKVSNASETRGLPAPTFNVSQLIQSFALRNLSKVDMVTLSGGHTLGFSHCSSFNTRLFHFNTVDEVDPTIEDTFAHKLRMKCPEHNKDHAAGAFLDSTATKFDNQYYVDISQGRGLFSSDQSLFSQQVDLEVKALVLEYARNETAFFHNFAISMVNMGNVGIKSELDGEIRHNCHFVNPVL